MKYLYLRTLIQKALIDHLIFNWNNFNLLIFRLNEFRHQDQNQLMNLLFENIDLMSIFEMWPVVWLKKASMCIIGYEEIFEKKNVFFYDYMEQWIN